nr:hypothetical protein BgiMline_023938 [Biomphalaria glabrata]
MYIQSILIPCVALFLLDLVYADTIQQIRFMVTKGHKLSQGTQLKIINSTNISLALCASICTIECGSATFSVRQKTCITFRDKFYNFSMIWTQDPDWLVLFRDEAIQYGGWTLVFRAQNHINVSMYHTWTNNGQHDDNPLTSSSLNGCYRLDNLGGCKKHFRSSILDSWTAVKKVKLSVYVNGSEVNYIEFQGASTSRETWFKQALISNSSWSNIMTDSSVNYFSLQGYAQGDHARRFIIFGGHGTCSLETTYFLAVDQASDDCLENWKVPAGSYPIFIASRAKGMIQISLRDYALADVMAVFVKF